MDRELVAAKLDLKSTSPLSIDCFPDELHPLASRYNEALERSKGSARGDQSVAALLSLLAVQQKNYIITASVSYVSFMEALEKNNPKEADAIRKRIVKHEVWVGMPKEIFVVARGVPEGKRETNGPDGKPQEVWIYADGEEYSSFCFEEGKLKEMKR
jgi:hypothetical protein